MIDNINIDEIFQYPRELKESKAFSIGREVGNNHTLFIPSQYYGDNLKIDDFNKKYNINNPNGYLPVIDSFNFEYPIADQEYFFNQDTERVKNSV